MRPKTTAKQGYAHCDTQDGNPTHARIDARGGRGLMGKKAMRLGMQEEHAPLDGDTRGGDLAESKTRGHSTWVVAVALIERRGQSHGASAPVLLTNADAETKLC